MPAAGCVSPHHSWPIPNARLMLARPSPVVELRTPRKSPIDWRAPIVTAKTPPAASSTSQSGTLAGAARGGTSARTASGIGRLLGFDGERRQAVVDQRVQLGDAAAAELRVERELGALPRPLRFAPLGAPARRQRDEA